MIIYVTSSYVFPLIYNQKITDDGVGMDESSMVRNAMKSNFACTQLIFLLMLLHFQSFIA